MIYVKAISKRCFLARETILVIVKLKCYKRIAVIPLQCRAARGLVDLSQSNLASSARVGLSTIRNFEAGRTTPVENNLAAIRSAFEARGVEFIPENGGGAGVRLAVPAKRHTEAGTFKAFIEQQTASADEVRAAAAGAVDRVLADVDATGQEKAERHEALTDEPIVIAKARGRGKPAKR